MVEIQLFITLHFLATISGSTQINPSKVKMVDGWPIILSIKFNFFNLLLISVEKILF